MFLCHLGESWRFSFYRLEKISGCCSVTQSCLTLYPTECSMPGFPLLFPLLSPRICSNSFPLSWGSHPIILSSLAPFSFCPQYFPTSGSFAVSWLIASGGQNIGATASASVLPMNIQYQFPLGLTGLIFLLSKGHSRVFSCTTVQKHQFFNTQPALWFSTHIDVWLLRK